MADKTRSQFGVPIAITGTGALDIAAGVTADINANLTVSSAFDTKDPIKGDGTAESTLRILYIIIENGTAADTIKCTSVSRWQGDANGAEDNLGKGGDTGVFALSAPGGDLTLQDSGLTGDCVSVLAQSIHANSTGTVLNVSGSVSGGIVLSFTNGTTGAAADLPLLVDGSGGAAALIANVTYVTSA